MSASANRTGAFSRQNVDAGRYKVMVCNPAEGGYLQTVRYGGQESKERVIQSVGAGGKLEVVLAFDSGIVTGSVQDGSGAAALGAAVFGYPKIQRRRLLQPDGQYRSERPLRDPRGRSRRVPGDGGSGVGIGERSGAGFP